MANVRCGCLRIGNWNRRTFSSALQRRLDVLVPRRVGWRPRRVDYTVLRFLSCGPRVRGCPVEIKIARLIMGVFTVACIASFLPRIDSLSHSALPFSLLYSSLLFYSLLSSSFTCVLLFIHHFAFLLLPPLRSLFASSIPSLLIPSCLHVFLPPPLPPSPLSFVLPFSPA